VDTIDQTGHDDSSVTRCDPLLRDRLDKSEGFERRLREDPESLPLRNQNVSTKAGQDQLTLAPDFDGVQGWDTISP
jgi:hypothetical protein